ncbi:hypothetical protein AB0I84_50400, partial [Streptomyces spectabilis]
MIALPGEGVVSYHLRPPGNGDDADDWSAPADGTTLRPVPPKATHATPLKRDIVYDARADQASMA